MMLLSSSVSLPEKSSSTFFFGGFGGVANGAREQGIESADGHHARGGDFVLEVVGELGELVDVAFDAIDVALELREDFVDVGGNFGHGAGEDVEIVVAIHFEFAELVEEATFAAAALANSF